MSSERERQSLVATVDAHFRATAADTGCSRLDDRVRQALLAVPRERFVPPSVHHLAYRDSPLPIGHEQTISQPFIVALTVQLLAPEAHHRVLDVGCGCGYQAAVLAQLVDRVYGIELIAALADRARDTLRDLDIDRVSVRCGDGARGWPEEAPFDGIAVAAAAHGVPDALPEQLRVGGRLVLPVEDERGWQHLRLIERVAADRWQQRDVLAVRFVPLITPTQPNQSGQV